MTSLEELTSLCRDDKYCIGYMYGGISSGSMIYSSFRCGFISNLNEDIWMDPNIIKFSGKTNIGNTCEKSSKYCYRSSGNLLFYSPFFSQGKKKSGS